MSGRKPSLAVLLALDNAVNTLQSAGDRSSRMEEGTAQSGLSDGHLSRLTADDGKAGCMMGIVMALIMAFGLLMGGVTLYFATANTPDEPSELSGR